MLLNLYQATHVGLHTLGCIQSYLDVTRPYLVIQIAFGQIRVSPVFQTCLGQTRLYMTNKKQVMGL